MMSKKKVSANPPQATQSWGEWFNSLFKKKKQDADASVENAKPIASGPSRSSRMNSTGKWAAIIAAAALFIGLGVATGGIGPLAFTVAVGAVMIGARAAHIYSVRKGEQRANEKADASASNTNTANSSPATTPGSTAQQTNANTTAATANNTKANQTTSQGSPAAKAAAALNSLPNNPSVASKAPVENAENAHSAKPNQ